MLRNFKIEHQMLKDNVEKKERKNIGKGMTFQEGHIKLI